MKEKVIRKKEAKTYEIIEQMKRNTCHTHTAFNILRVCN